jgi:asparagine synthetase B (glutamine-hydrolysing)
MPGIVAIFGKGQADFSEEELSASIDPRESNESSFIDIPGGKAGAAALPGNPLGRSVFSPGGESPGFFCGDLTDHEEVPWNGIRSSLLDGDIGWLGTLSGTFSLVLWDGKKNVLHAVSDRLSQQPAYYSLAGGRFIFSTAIAPFCRFLSSAEMSREWLYEFLYFNIPVCDTSPLKRVLRLPPATVLSIEPESMKYSLNRYAEPFSRPEILLSGRAAMDRAVGVFGERVPRLYPADGKVAVSLTAGFDSRTVLAFAPEQVRDSVTTYTYGVPGCSELEVSSATAKALGFEHKEIHFGDSLENELEDLIFETVFLSGGLEKAQRATLAYVYRELAGGNDGFPVVLTGLSGDHLFRDHLNGRGNVPSIISSDMMDTIQSGELRLNKVFFSEAFGEKYGEFEQHIRASLERLTERHGELNDPASYLRYLVYEAAPKYFGGEYALAREFTALRSPFWDSEIISLAFGIEYGTLGFSENLPVKDPYREKVLQAHVIDSVPQMRGTGISGLPLSAFSSDSKALYRMMKILRKLPGKVGSLFSRPGFIPLEDWRRWFAALDWKGTALAGYVSPSLIERARKGDDLILLGKLITAETVLQLIAGGWERHDSRQ